MYRLIKLAFFGLLGYAIYEFVRGLLDYDTIGGGGERHGSRELKRALDRDENRVNMTGPARGERVVAEESDGKSTPHMVGRGVVTP